MKPRLLLFDLDGTLLSPERTIHPSNLRALNGAMARGIRVGFATGRTRLSVQSYVDLVAPTGPLVLMNGCALWDVERDEPVAQRQLDHVSAVRALRIITDLGIHVNVYIDRALYVANRGELSLASELKDGVPHTQVGDVVAFVHEHRHRPFKLLCIEPTGAFAPLLSRFEAAALTDSCTVVRSEPTYLEVLPAGTNKAAMLSQIERAYGIAPDEIVAFGDQLNDLELLRSAGIGVAMGNAHALAIEASDVQIGPNDSDAIARYVDAL